MFKFKLFRRYWNGRTELFREMSFIPTKSEFRSHNIKTASIVLGDTLEYVGSVSVGNFCLILTNIFEVTDVGPEKRV